MWKQILYETSLYGKGKIDETLAKLHERKHSTKEEKKEQRERGPNSKPEEQNPKWVMAGASRQIMFQSSHQLQRSHQLQEAYQKEGASHQNKSCFKTPTNHKKHIKKRKGWKE
jgi:hypothetical protein